MYFKHEQGLGTELSNMLTWKVVFYNHGLGFVSEGLKFVWYRGSREEIKKLPGHSSLLSFAKHKNVFLN